MGGHGSGGLFPGTTGDNRKAETTGERQSGGLSTSASHGQENVNAMPSASMMREQLLGEACTDQARSIIKQLYRKGASVGDGGTADAIRKQLLTGELVGGKDHVRKGRERLRQIRRLLSKYPNHPDRVLLEKLRDDLKRALGGA